MQKDKKTYELIEIEPYILKKVKIVPFRSKTVIIGMSIIALVTILAFLVFCLIQFLG